MEKLELLTGRGDAAISSQHDIAGLRGKRDGAEIANVQSETAGCRRDAIFRDESDVFFGADHVDLATKRNAGSLENGDP